MTHSLSPAYFDALYAADPDPWRFASSDYERDKYAATLAALPPGRFAAALEVGCSIGVLTAQLARRCTALLALDVAEAALAQARARCADLPQVRFARRQVPDAWPAGTFDLVLLSEVLYYLSAADLDATAAAVRRSLRPGGTVVLVHYVLPTNYPLTGDAAADRFIAAARLPADLRQRTDAYRLDRLRAWK